MPEIVPTLLAPYLQVALIQSSLTVVTSTLSTPANWLLVRLLYSALKGVDETALSTLIKTRTTTSDANVIIISLTRPLDLWIELCRKLVSQEDFLSPPFSCILRIDLSQGLDLLSLVKSRKLHYIDGLSTVSQTRAERPGVTLKELTFDALYEVISSTTNASSNVGAQSHNGDASASKPVIIIDGLDFLAACQPGIDMVTIQSFLLNVRSLGRAVIVTASADAPLLHNHYGSATPLEQFHAALVSSLAHQSACVMQLRNLNTGSARDITGVLRISRGGAHDGNKDDHAMLDEAEWLYQVKGDGSARVWCRGE